MTRPALTLLLFALLIGAPASSQAINPHPHRASRFAYDVHITPTSLPSGSSAIDIGPTLWSVQGFNLRELFAHVYGIDPTRIDLPAPASDSSRPNSPQPESPQPDSPRYDVSLSLAGDEADTTVQAILGAALSARFHLAAALETRSVEVYVLTAPHGAGSGLALVKTLFSHGSVPVSFHAEPTSAEDPDPGQETITVAGRLCPGISSASIQARAATLNSLARTLEELLDRPMLDETHLTAAYNFHIPEYRSQAQLFALLHDTLGLEIGVSRRELAILAIHSIAQPDPPRDQTAALQTPFPLTR